MKNLDQQFDTLGMGGDDSVSHLTSFAPTYNEYTTSKIDVCSWNVPFISVVDKPALMTGECAQRFSNSYCLVMLVS